MTWQVKEVFKKFNLPYFQVALKTARIGNLPSWVHLDTHITHFCNKATLGIAPRVASTLTTQNLSIKKQEKSDVGHASPH